MTASVARKQLRDLVSSGDLEDSYAQAYNIIADSYREYLDTSRIHVVDLSEQALRTSYSTALKYYNISQEDIAANDAFEIEFKASLDSLWGLVESGANYTANSIQSAAVQIQDISLGAYKRAPLVVYVKSSKSLVCRDFKSARDFLSSKVSKKMPSSKFFGMLQRNMTKADYAEAGYSLEPVKGGGYRARSASGNLRKRTRYFNTSDQEIVSPGSSELRTYNRSIFDIGHNYIGAEYADISSVIALKLTDLAQLNFPSNSQVAKEVAAQLENLRKLEVSVSIDYGNNVPNNSLNSLSNIDAGYLRVGVEFYTLNGEKAKVESSAYRAAKNIIFKEIYAKVRSTNTAFKISGSNTAIEDLVGLVRAKFAFIFSNKAKATLPKKHAPVASTATISPKSKYNSKANGPILNGAINMSSNTPSKPAMRNTRGQFTSLASLQNIINDQLAKAIQKNMGTGDRKDILNYRTGRLANSAKVERMTQSRAGMITAFYTYMRNPYGTFSEGGAQGIPKSRDPKLLISKSIREIAATQVANRMRAVLS